MPDCIQKIVWCSIMENSHHQPLLAFDICSARKRKCFQFERQSLTEVIGRCKERETEAKFVLQLIWCGENCFASHSHLTIVTLLFDYWGHAFLSLVCRWISFDYSHRFISWNVWFLQVTSLYKIPQFVCI